MTDLEIARKYWMVAPSDRTLKKYGMVYDDWLKIVDRQRGVCPICRNPISSPVIDHEHVKGWKKMKPEKKKLYIRGVVCRYCNKFNLGSAVTLDRARATADYLMDYKDRCSST